ncbi:137_t:CDS:2 [Gigaspora margarita]|uniref:137_t:CDS:1 n=1 Tax=Gigaspora margarita TaxID=4874 RepID=A0ABN7W3H6_GIGMA|nr:137_t:CDS:2 [Gigaspora margarita]
MSSQNMPIILSKAFKRNLRRKEQRAIKKAKFENHGGSIIVADTDSTSNTIVNQTDEREDIFYDPLRHKTQVETRLSTEDQSREYIRSLWISEDFLASDLKSVNNSEPINIISPQFTFLEKFLEKRLQRQIVKKLINKGLFPSDTVKHNTYSLKLDTLSNSQLDILSDAIYNEMYKNNVSEKSLLPQSSQSISTTFVIPADFMRLLESEIFGNNNSADSTTFTSFGRASSTDLERKKLWGDFACWACFFIGPNFRKQFQDHCRRLWFKVEHAYEHEEAQNKPLEDHNIREVFQKNPKDKLYIALETTKKVAHGIDLEGYRHIFKPQCFKNAFGETIVDFFDLANPLVAKNARNVIDRYYYHTLNNPSHQSKQFASNMIEHFCSFTDSNNEPYTTANTASSHCQEHLVCVQELIRGLQPLSNTVNNYFHNTYPMLYTKMKNLNLGPNVPKSFGIFPTVGINYNTISQFHRDLKDHRNTLCVVCPLGIFEGGELTFPELKLAIHAKQGHGIAFRSNLLIHGNLPIITGSRHSVVFYVHSTVIKQKRKFGSLFADYDWVGIMRTGHHQNISPQH